MHETEGQEDRTAARRLVKKATVEDQTITTTSTESLIIEPPTNEAQIRFWLYLDGKTVSLQDAVSLANGITVPEVSQKLLFIGNTIYLG